MTKRFNIFANMPAPKIIRSRQDLTHRVHTSMSIGKLYPIDFFEVLPNSDIYCKANNVSRLTSEFVKPVMDNIYLDTYHFFVPLRQCYEDAEKVFGVPDPSSYTENTLKKIPSTEGVVSSRTVADYLGLPLGPVKKSGGSGVFQDGVSILPFRAFARIYEYDFRNQNIIDEMFINKGGAIDSEKLNDNPWSVTNYTGQLPNVQKFRDYFTSLLPNPQKGEPVTIPLSSANIPVDFKTSAGVKSLGQEPVQFSFSKYVEPWSNLQLFSSGSPTQLAKPFVGSVGSPGDATNNINGWNINGNVDLSNVTGISVNDFRLLVQKQKMLERDAIFGTRFNSYLLAHFGQYISDDTLQYPVYLGGGRTQINTIPVVSTGSTVDEAGGNPLGSLAAYAWTDGQTGFRYHVKEHGYIFTVGCLRYRHSYQQGRLPVWERFTRDDFFDPLFGTIGMQPVYKGEIYSDGSPNRNTEVLGYKEAWNEYRVLPSRVSGELRSNIPTSLDKYHFADYYGGAPTLNKQFIEETPLFVDRSLRFDSEKQDQFVFDFNFVMPNCVIPMPKRSTPGWVDHW